MNIGALLGSGVQELKALQILNGFAPPWLQERIEAAMECMSEGDSLGRALRNSGYDFPSREAVNYLSLLDKGMVLLRSSPIMRTAGWNRRSRASRVGRMPPNSFLSF